MAGGHREKLQKTLIDFGEDEVGIMKMPLIKKWKNKWFICIWYVVHTITISTCTTNHMYTIFFCKKRNQFEFVVITYSTKWKEIDGPCEQFGIMLSLYMYTYKFMYNVIL